MQLAVERRGTANKRRACASGTDAPRGALKGPIRRGPAQPIKLQERSRQQLAHQTLRLHLVCARAATGAPAPARSLHLRRPRALAMLSLFISPRLPAFRLASSPLAPLTHAVSPPRTCSPPLLHVRPRPRPRSAPSMTAPRT